MDGQSVRCPSASDISPACAVSVTIDLLSVRTACECCGAMQVGENVVYFPGCIVVRRQPAKHGIEQL